MGWRALDNYETAAHERWKALPWRERYGWRSVAVLAMIAALAAALVYAGIARAAPVDPGDVSVIDGDTTAGRAAAERSSYGLHPVLKTPSYCPRGKTDRSRQYAASDDRPDDYVFRVGGRDAGRCYAMRAAGNRPVWRWTVCGSNVGGMENSLQEAQRCVKAAINDTQSFATNPRCCPGCWNL